MKYSLVTESEPRHVLSWICVCPKCVKHSRVMNIESVFPMLLSQTSIVTYVCRTCDYREDILVNEKPPE
jgi:hypothetical protein